MGVNNRRQLLVKVGSFMKLSWRASRENLIEKDYSENDDHSAGNQRRRGGDRKGKRRRNLFVTFDDEVSEIRSTYNEPLSKEGIEARWYQSDDFSRFKKDIVLCSLNYMNARRARKPIDETYNCIRGIEDMCIRDNAVRQRHIAEKKYSFKVIRDEQGRQKKELQLKQEQKYDRTTIDKTKIFSAIFNMDDEKLRSASLVYTRGARDRALGRGIAYARAEQSFASAKSPSMKNLFKAARRTQSATMVL